jgi:multidrug resistance protein
MAVTASSPEDTSDKMEKETLPANPDVERTTNGDDPLALLSKIETSSEAHPIRWPLWKKWSIVFVYCLLQVFVTLTSTTYVSVEFLIMEKWTSSAQVATLGQSMFIVGTAVGPAFLGPLSDISGRKWVYVGSVAMYAILNIGTALADNYPMLVIFCFLIGCAGSVALCNVAGTIADLFGDTDGAAQPMALFVLSANFGPSLGSPIGEWIGINPHLGWRWIFYINIIIGGAFAFGLCFIPETLPRIVISRAVTRRGSVDQNELDIALGSSKLSAMREIRFVATMALRIMVTEPIVISLGLYNGFAYGLLFLYLDGVFGVFVVNNGLSYVGASLTYLNFCVGVTVTFCFVPVQTYLFTRHRLKHGHTPEARFLTSLVTVWLFPISLFWFAWTCDGDTSYWSPVVAGAVLGFCDPLLWLAMLNYITDSYPNVAASAIAAFLIPSFLIAAGCAHAGVAMFANMNVRWAFSTLGFISIGLVVLVYVLFFWGPVLRRWSPLARTF